jgi:hypothetical protein
MFDPTTDYLGMLIGHDSIRNLTIGCNMISAPMIAFFAFAVTEGAGFHCPLAALRLLQRIVLCFFSITLMYNALLIYETDRVPIGSAFLVNVFIMVSTIISGIRHMMAPPISSQNTWKRHEPTPAVPLRWPYH